MPSINLFRRSTKAPTESSSSIGTKLKESKLVKKASALNQALHAKQAQFKASVDKNCHKIGSCVASKIKHNKSKSNNLDASLELNDDTTSSLASPCKPEKVNLSQRLEQEIDHKVHSLSSSLNGIVADINTIFEACQERRQKKKTQEERKLLEKIKERENQMLKQAAIDIIMRDHQSAMMEHQNQAFCKSYMQQQLEDINNWDDDLCD